MTVVTPEWVKDAVFYQIFPDRFAKSDRVRKDGLHLEAWDTPPTTYGFKGGDLAGVTDRLDYLQDLGITAIYFNPVFESPSQALRGGAWGHRRRLQALQRAPGSPRGRRKRCKG